jgi:hypothetical protein
VQASTGTSELTTEQLWWHAVAVVMVPLTEDVKKVMTIKHAYATAHLLLLYAGMLNHMARQYQQHWASQTGPQ